MFFDALKHSIEYCIANPYVAYPLFGSAAVLALPPTRRLMYKVTLGRFRSPESIASSSAQRLESISSQMTGYTSEVTKLQTRLQTAEEEYTRSVLDYIGMCY